MTARLDQRRKRWARARLLKKHGRVCWRCNQPIDGVVTIDHIVPRSRGGGNNFANLRLACERCNNEAHDGKTITPPKRRPELVERQEQADRSLTSEAAGERQRSNGK